MWKFLADRRLVSGLGSWTESRSSSIFAFRFGLWIASQEEEERKYCFGGCKNRKSHFWCLNMAGWHCRMKFTGGASKHGPPLLSVWWAVPDTRTSAVILLPGQSKADPQLHPSSPRPSQNHISVWDCRYSLT